MAMSAASSIKRKQLPAHSISIEIYCGIARFPGDSTVFGSLSTNNFNFNVKFHFDFRFLLTVHEKHIMIFWF